MKKILALLLVLCMASTLVLAESADFTGDWHLTKVSMSGMELNPSMLGMDMTISLAADGTGTIAMGDEPMPATWTEADGTITVSDETGEGIAFTVNAEGCLETLDAESGLLLVFSREVVETATFELPEAVMVENIQDFDGTWNATTLSLMGMIVPVETLGLDMTLVIENGSVTMMDGSENPTPVVCELIDGKLVSTEVIDEAEGLTNELAFYMSVDGTIVLNIEEAGTVVFERQIAE